jgi:hypothetical protein
VAVANRAGATRRTNGLAGAAANRTGTADGAALAIGLAESAGAWHVYPVS